MLFLLRAVPRADAAPVRDDRAIVSLGEGHVGHGKRIVLLSCRNLYGAHAHLANPRLILDLGLSGWTVPQRSEVSWEGEFRRY